MLQVPLHEGRCRKILQRVKCTCCRKWRDAVQINRKILIRVLDLFVVFLLFLLRLPLLLPATPRLFPNDDSNEETQRGRRKEAEGREEGESTDRHSQ